MGGIWQIQHQVEAKELKSNFFQFIFGSNEDKLKVELGVKWIFKNQYLILTIREEGLNETHSKFKELNLWVQVSNLPLNWLCTNVSLKIGNVFEHTRNISVIKTGEGGGQRGSFLRILVVVDVSEPLPRFASMKLNNTQVLARFQYVKLLNICFYCEIIDYLERSCKKKEEDMSNGVSNEGQYEE
ncbi:Unknown protein [Striga hermonthica]|uniref:DUF4283 domain-containing protein n=1 Tax=Striga hermonthica TaxID=68872 RepID=A0A9N7MCY7_STRHE|nr:Unknown protein [Striga hermonthica]